MNLEQLTKELKIEKIDQVIGGIWTTGVTGCPGSSGSDDFYGVVLFGHRIGFYHTWT